MDITSVINIGALATIAPDIFRDISPHILNVAGGVYGFAALIAICVSVLCIFGIFYSTFSMKVVDDIIEKSIEVPIVPAYVDEPSAEPELAIRWRKVLELVDSPNQNDWVRAIMEADMLLDQVLEKAGYHGDGVGGKLMMVEKGDMENLDNAWEAHKVRNNLAHDPSFVINQYEAKRTVELFRRVFAEYYVI